MTMIKIIPLHIELVCDCFQDICRCWLSVLFSHNNNIIMCIADTETPLLYIEYYIYNSHVDMQVYGKYDTKTHCVNANLLSMYNVHTFCTRYMIKLHI